MRREIKNPGRGYSGREKTKMYQYNSNGKYLRSYESQSEVRQKYFSKDIGKRPLLLEGYRYGLLPDNTYISNYRIGRDKLLKQEKIRNCPFCHKDKRSRKFSVYNLIGEKIAEFSSQLVATKLLNIPQTTISYRLNHNSFSSNDNLIFKYD